MQVAVRQSAHGDGRGWLRSGDGQCELQDSWRVHFADTMRGGKFLNNWRMAELHAQESADRVWELETYGALFDRTKDGRISQRNFGGHTYPRLAHVGDRTGLEIIRTLQQKIVSLQQEDKAEFGDYEARIKIFHECAITELILDKTGGDAKIAGAFGYWRETGKFILFEAPAMVCQPPAASASRSRCRRTPGSTPATGTRSRCGQARA